MKNKTTILAVLALLSATFVISGCPYRHRPHIPHPHVPRPLQPVDSMLQIDRQNSAAVLPMWVEENPARPYERNDGMTLAGPG